MHQNGCVPQQALFPFCKQRQGNTSNNRNLSPNQWQPKRSANQFCWNHSWSFTLWTRLHTCTQKPDVRFWSALEVLLVLCLVLHMAGMWLQSGVPLACPLRCVAPDRIVANKAVRRLVQTLSPTPDEQPSTQPARQVQPPHVPPKTTAHRVTEMYYLVCPVMFGCLYEGTRALPETAWQEHCGPDQS